jgi:phosphoglycolate phosphatase-like HAD superfamily hydrolase
MRPTVLLFDVDGTLVSTGGAGRAAIDRAFHVHTGRADACDAIAFGGMTDRAIVRAGLVAIGVEATAALIEAILATYLEHLGDAIASAPSYVVHAGVEQALDAAHARRGVAVGLGTGNVREGARIKLDRVGLYRRFAFGGFGCDHEDRAALLAVGARRGAAEIGAPVEACRVVVIGDTPRDVSAGRAIGAEVLAVATGASTRADLERAAPTWLFDDLAAAGALAALLDGAVA